MTSTQNDVSTAFPWFHGDLEDVEDIEIPGKPGALRDGQNATVYGYFSDYLNHTDASNSPYYLHAVVALHDGSTPQGWSGDERATWIEHTESVYAEFVIALTKLRSRAAGCSICRETSPAAPIYLTCDGRHVYCHECIANWVLQGKRTCPLCRAECIPNTLERIYVQTDTVLVEAKTGTFTTDFGSVTLIDPDLQEAMSSSTKYDIEFQVAGGIAWPDDYSMYKVEQFTFNAGTLNDNPLVFFKA